MSILPRELTTDTGAKAPGQDGLRILHPSARPAHSWHSVNAPWVVGSWVPALGMLTGTLDI